MQNNKLKLWKNREIATGSEKTRNEKVGRVLKNKTALRSCFVLKLNQIKHSSEMLPS
jgi:hypothetical protein